MCSARTVKPGRERNSRNGADTAVFSPENGNPSPTRQLVSSSCAYSHHCFPVLPVHALGVLHSDSERDGRARIENRRRAQDAAAVQAAANQDLQDYNEALKKARAEIYAEQEVARQAILQERSKNLKAMRTLAQKEVAEGKKKIEAELAIARKEIEASAPVMAGEITRSILEKPLSLQGETRRS